MDVRTIYSFILILFILLSVVRFIVSIYFFHITKISNVVRLPSESTITILQPILSGDETLEDNLRTNLQLHPQANFIWLIDKSDTNALQIASSILNTISTDKCRIIETPDVTNGMNPKTFKLQIGVAACSTPFIGIIDDDTILPSLSIAKAIYQCKLDTLVTGLPYYTVRNNFWSSLLSAFVNSNSLLSYPVMAAITKPATINGMFYVLRKNDLDKRGGFERIKNELCDDYAIASLFRTSGGHIKQSDITHPVATTVNNFKDYCSLSRRWMIFANRFIKANFSASIAVFIVIPSLLPILLFTTSLFISVNFLFFTLVILMIKSSLNAVFRIWILASNEKWHHIILEIIADIILPLFYVSALFWPKHFKWRHRRIKILNERIIYK